MPDTARAVSLRNHDRLFWGRDTALPCPQLLKAKTSNLKSDE